MQCKHQPFSSTYPPPSSFDSYSYSSFERFVAGNLGLGKYQPLPHEVQNFKKKLSTVCNCLLYNNDRVLFSAFRPSVAPSLAPHAHNAALTSRGDAFLLQGLDNESRRVRGNWSSYYMKSQILVKKQTGDIINSSRYPSNNYSILFGWNWTKNNLTVDPNRAIVIPLVHIIQAVKEGGKVIITPQKGKGRSESLPLTANIYQFPRSFQTGMRILESLLTEFNPKLSYRRPEHFD